ncbi:hypothetical protein [Bradyrhizobium sp. BWC-3-1]|uniref:hypothetical protein n=1 Tax=Bradyrhizobium sp. BWC-3-1 TaxID=3080012 RepID=UPI00293E663A|nr:hypothetical protein [Bradyrhizobium sp. BWC-3-1]WOH55121.1 hypothetical protein RX329_22620 [Bradyrhizobium sp. BWC-3-1]
MILDILTVLFLVSGFLLVLRMFVEWRRDVLHGPYVTKERDADFERLAGEEQAKALAQAEQDKAP